MAVDLRKLAFDHYISIDVDTQESTLKFAREVAEAIIKRIHDEMHCDGLLESHGDYRRILDVDDLSKINAEILGHRN